MDSSLKSLFIGAGFLLGLTPNQHAFLIPYPFFIFYAFQKGEMYIRTWKIIETNSG